MCIFKNYSILKEVQILNSLSIVVFKKMEDEFNIFHKWKTTSTFWKMKNNINFFKLEDELNFCNWKRTPISLLVKLAQLVPACSELGTAHPHQPGKVYFPAYKHLSSIISKVSNPGTTFEKLRKQNFSCCRVCERLTLCSASHQHQRNFFCAGV